MRDLGGRKRDLGAITDRSGGQPRPSRDLEPIGRLAARQNGCVSRAQLLSLGYTERQIDRLLESGWLVRLHPGVYGIGVLSLSTLGRLSAAMLLGGSESFLSHRTSGAMNQFRAHNARAIALTVIGGSRHRRRSGAVTIHRTRAVHPDEVVTRGNLRFSSVLRMLVESAASETRAELERLVNEAGRRNMLSSQEKIEQMLERHRRRPGIALLARVLHDYRPRPDQKSNLERAVLAALERRPGIPTPEHNVYIAGWEIDLFWPAARVALELDGRQWHSSAADIEHDRLKDAKLLSIGIVPMRITDKRFEHHPEDALDDLEKLLSQRSRDGEGQVGGRTSMRPE